MPKIIIQNLHNKEIFTDKENKTLLSAIHENGVDWMHACGGKGKCTTCKVVVEKGLAHFSKESEAELKFRAMDRLQANERLICQCSITDDVEVRVAEAHKFNHITYSE